MVFLARLDLMSEQIAGIVEEDQRVSPRVLAGCRVVFVFPGLELGGAERQAIHLARFLQAQLDARVQVWGFSGPGPASALCDQHQIQHRSMEAPLRGGVARKLMGMGGFVRELRRAKVDVLLPYTMAQNILCGLTWRWGGARLCVWNQRDEGRKRVGQAIERRAVRQTPMFISNSEHGAAFLTNTLHADAARVFVVRNGVEIPPANLSRDSWRQAQGLKPDQFVACMIANLHSYKDHATLLQAWRKVVDELARTGMQATLLLAGRRDDTAEAVEGQVASLGLGETVRIMGQVSDISSLLGAVDLGVFSSRLEGCPNGVLECMAAGLPVVATDIIGIREALGDADEVLAPPGDASAMAAGIIRLALNATRRRELGAANRRRIDENFGLGRMCSQTAKLIASALQPKVQPMTL